MTLNCAPTLKRYDIEQNLHFTLASACPSTSDNNVLIEAQLNCIIEWCVADPVHWIPTSHLQSIVTCKNQTNHFRLWRKGKNICTGNTRDWQRFFFSFFSQVSFMAQTCKNHCLASFIFFFFWHIRSVTNNWWASELTSPFVNLMEVAVGFT